MDGKQGRKRELAIIALLSEPTLKAAAANAGIGLRTLKGWLVQPEFKKSYEDAKSELLRTATAKLRAEACKAVDTLAAISRNEKSPAHARVGAAIAILRLSLDAETQEVLAERMAQLEAHNANI